MLQTLGVCWLAACGTLLAGAEARAEGRTETPAVQARIARIEQGLLLPVTVQGQASQGMALAQRMRYWRVPGVSVAVINHGAIEWTRGYGVTDAGGTQAVTPQTLFQVGSLSKPVAAALVMRLAAVGKFDLDQDINQRLRTWRLPADAEPVTARTLLSHTAGMPEFGLTGYAADQIMPTLLQVLRGEAPANNPAAVRKAGHSYAYSSLGYVALQQYLEDGIGQPFAALAQQEVLQPLGLHTSRFAASLEGAPAAQAAAGHDLDGAVLPGRWRRHPELAATGLWSNASEMAQFALALQRAEQGKDQHWLSQQVSHAMLTPVSNDYGLGFELDHAGSAPAFHHSGSTIGYKALVFAYSGTGQGAVILVNADGGWPLIEELMRSIAAEYGWQDYRPIARSASPARVELYGQFSGEYKVGNTALRISRVGDKLMIAGPPLGPAPLELLPSGDYDYFLREKDATLHFDVNQGQPVQTLTFMDGRPRAGKRVH